MFTNQFSHDKENTKINGQRCRIGVNSYSVSAMNTWLGCDFEMRLLSFRAVFTVIHIIVNKIRSIKYRWTLCKKAKVQSLAILISSITF